MVDFKSFETSMNRVMKIYYLMAFLLCPFRLSGSEMQPWEFIAKYRDIIVIEGDLEKKKDSLLKVLNRVDDGDLVAELHSAQLHIDRVIIGKSYIRSGREVINLSARLQRFEGGRVKNIPYGKGVFVICPNGLFSTPRFELLVKLEPDDLERLLKVHKRWLETKAAELDTAILELEGNN